MKLKKKLAIFLLIFFTFTASTQSREMSIQQLEERKKIDLERKKKRDDRGSKKFAKDIKLTTDIIFITKEREVPAVLSNLDPILNDEGFYGIQLGVEDNLTTGRFLGHDYKVKMIQVSLKEDLEEEFKKLIKSGYTYFVADLNSGELSKLSNLKESKNILLINIRSKEDSLRNEFCKTNLIHVAPSYTMLSDALTQYLLKKIISIV